MIQACTPHRRCDLFLQLWNGAVALLELCGIESWPLKALVARRIDVFTGNRGNEDRESFLADRILKRR